MSVFGFLHPCCFVDRLPSDPREKDFLYNELKLFPESPARDAIADDLESISEILFTDVRLLLTAGPRIGLQSGGRTGSPASRFLSWQASGMWMNCRP